MGHPKNLIGRRVLNFIKAYVSRRGVFPKTELIANACGIPEGKADLAIEYLRKRGFVRKYGRAREVVGYVHRRGLVRNFTNSDLGKEFEPLACFSEAFDFSDLLCDPDNWAFRIQSNEYAEDGYIVGDTLIFKRVEEGTPGELVLFTDQHGVVRLARYMPLKQGVKMLRPTGRYEIYDYDLIKVFGLVTGLIRRTARPVTLEMWNSVLPPRPEPVNQWKPAVEWT